VGAKASPVSIRAAHWLQKNLGMPEAPNLPESPSAFYYANAG
jgi:hypothetical protein